MGCHPVALLSCAEIEWFFLESLYIFIWPLLRVYFLRNCDLDLDHSWIKVIISSVSSSKEWAQRYLKPCFSLWLRYNMSFYLLSRVGPYGIRLPMWLDLFHGSWKRFLLPKHSNLVKALSIFFNPFQRTNFLLHLISRIFFLFFINFYSNISFIVFYLDFVRYYFSSVLG